MRVEQLLAILLIMVGVVMIIGTRRQWRWLVDPPDDLWPFYFPSLIKRFFGGNALRIFIYITALSAIVAMAFLLAGYYSLLPIELPFS